MTSSDPFNCRTKIKSGSAEVEIFSLSMFEKAYGSIQQLPYSIRILLEAAIRNLDGFSVTEDHVKILAGWQPELAGGKEIPFMPARVLLQDFTGVPALVDLAAMRSAVKRIGLDPARINPDVQVDLVIDHSVQVDAFGSSTAVEMNIKREFERNGERYMFIKWGQKALSNFRVVPPKSGIVHQVNLEYLAGVIQTKKIEGKITVFPDTLVGTDSHTTMINGLGVLGWGVGGIEAEAVMLGQPLYMTLPHVVGVELRGRLRPGVTATDLVLMVTERLRSHGVVGKFVEFHGEGVGALSLPDRATIANMAPEYGATMGLFPMDSETVRYLKLSGREADKVDLAEGYFKEQGLFGGTQNPSFSESLVIDISEAEPALSGPRRPQDRILLKNARSAFLDAMEKVYQKPLASISEGNGDKTRWMEEGGQKDEPSAMQGTACDDRICSLQVPVRLGPMEECHISHGSVVIAAITSCTNTSNPSVLIAAGLLARKAVKRGVGVRPWVKTSLAPGSRVVTRYLIEAGLMPYLEALRFHVVGYGCTTCIGNSGPLPDAVAKAVKDNDLVVTSVLSGNRNFEGRISPLVKANYLASPPLVVAYAIAGTMNINLDRDPLCHDPNGEPVYLKDLWPDESEVREAMKSVSSAMFQEEYNGILEGGSEWKDVKTSEGLIFDWQDDSTYIQEPSFFSDLGKEIPEIASIKGARALAVLGDTVTTDHISPAGAIAEDSPAGRYLISRGVKPVDFNSYGSRRGNHEVMVRGTFANIRLKNLLAPGIEGGFTTIEPGSEVLAIYDAAMSYRDKNIPLIVLAGKEYGTGSSRDWAAKGTNLLGIKAVIAQSYERIHRSNLVGMGVLPLQFETGENAEKLGLSGFETFDVDIPADLSPQSRLKVTATDSDGKSRQFEVTARLDSRIEVQYYRNGGILQTVLKEMIKNDSA